MVLVVVAKQLSTVIQSALSLSLNELRDDSVFACGGMALSQTTTFSAT